MSKADEMFKELGYEKFDNHPPEEEIEPNKWTTQDCRVIEYTQKATINGSFYTLFIRFHIQGKRVEVGASERREGYREMSRYRNPIFNAEELQAINEKVKELRMDIEEAKDILLNVVADEVVGTYCIEIQKETDCAKNCENDDCFIIRAIETVLKELELKDKVIDEMSKSFVTHMIGIAQEYSVDANFLEKEKLIEYFTNKVKLQSNKQSQ